MPSGLFIAEVIGYRIGARIAKRREHRRIRRNRGAHRAGRTVTFPGWALGEAAYCRRPPEGFLTVEADGRVYTCLAPDLPPTRRRVPVGRIRVVETAEADRTDGWTFRPTGH